MYIIATELVISLFIITCICVCSCVLVFLCSIIVEGYCVPVSEGVYLPWLCVQPSAVYSHIIRNGYTLAAMNGHTTCVDCLLSTPGIIVNIQ